MSEYRLMTEDQRGMVELVKEFLMKEYLPLVPEYDQKGEYPMEIHKKMGELGLFPKNTGVLVWMQCRSA